jgi:hypothetical protein
MTCINGWEYVTNIVPGQVVKQTLQQKYLEEYNVAYHLFLKTLLLNEDKISEFKNSDEKVYYIYIDCNNDVDIIETGTDYYIKFTKSKFLYSKINKIRKDLYSYYNSKNIYVKGPFLLQQCIYQIELILDKNKIENS